VANKELISIPGFEASGEILLTYHDADTGEVAAEELRNNLVVDDAFKIIPAVLGRDTNKQIEFISIGTGGDYAVQPVGPPVDTGTRNPPDVTDIGNRVEIFRAPIRAVDLPALNAVKFLAVLESGDANSSNIDEFALLSSDGTCFSHEVNEENPVAPNRAIKFTKNSGLIVVVQWTISFFRCSGSATPIMVSGSGGSTVTISPPIP